MKKSKHKEMTLTDASDFFDEHDIFEFDDVKEVTDVKFNLQKKKYGRQHRGSSLEISAFIFRTFNYLFYRGL